MLFFSRSLYFGKYNAKLKGVQLLLWMGVSLGMLLSGCSQATEEPLIVGAAASLTNAMEELGPLFTERTGIPVKMSYASSGTLRQQIEDGAPIDVFVSASQGKMNELVELEKVEEPRTLLKNRLVFVIEPETMEEIHTYNDLIGTDLRLAIGEPASVPAGKYAKEVLVYEELWDSLQQQMVFGKSVRQVTDYLNQGEVSSGFIYKTDLKVLNRKMQSILIPESYHTPVEYPVAIVRGTMHRNHAEAFNAFLKSDEAKRIFESYGFEMQEK